MVMAIWNHKSTWINHINQSMLTQKLQEQEITKKSWRWDEETEKKAKRILLDFWKQLIKRVAQDKRRQNRVIYDLCLWGMLGIINWQWHQINFHTWQTVLGHLEGQTSVLLVVWIFQESAHWHCMQQYAQSVWYQEGTCW